MKFLAYSGKLLFQPMFWGGFWTAVIFLIIHFLIAIFQGIKLEDVINSAVFLVVVLYFFAGMFISFFLCLILFFVSHIFFKNALEEEAVYRFTLYITAFISSLIFSSFFFLFLISFVLSMASRKLSIEDIFFRYWEPRIISIFVSICLSHIWASHYLAYLGKKNRRLEDPWD